MTLKLLLAEGLSPDHIASDIAVPLALVIFSGSVFALLWSNYGAKKGGLIYGIALFGFMGFIGVFWWFGAPGTPVASGPKNFPGQAADVYTPQWYPFEGGSERAEFFEADDTFDVPEDGEVQTGEFEAVSGYVGTTDIEDPMFASISGDLEGAAGEMLEQYFPRNDFGGLDIGAGFRTMLQENTPTIEGAEFTGYEARVASDAQGESRLFITEDNGQRLAAAVLEVVATYDGAEPVVVSQTEWFAFKDPGSIWLPSAVWTLVSFLLFGLCLALLDRIEQREKRESVEVEEARDVQEPIKQ